MIFEGVNNITNKDAFVELIQVYIRLVETMAERNKLVIPASQPMSDSVIEELMSMGVISEAVEVTLLKKVIKTNYQKFIDAVCFYLNNKSIYGNLLY